MVPNGEGGTEMGWRGIYGWVLSVLVLYQYE